MLLCCINSNSLKLKRGAVVPRTAPLFSRLCYIDAKKERLQRQIISAVVTKQSGYATKQTGYFWTKQLGLNNNLRRKGSLSGGLVPLNFSRLSSMPCCPTNPPNLLIHKAANALQLNRKVEAGFLPASIFSGCRLLTHPREIPCRHFRSHEKSGDWRRCPYAAPVPVCSSFS